jgi:plastocyanin
MRWTLALALLAVLLIAGAISCDHSSKTAASYEVRPDANGFVLQSFVPKEGGTVQWVNQDVPFRIRQLGHWPCRLEPASGVGKTVTCAVRKASGFQIWPYEITIPRSQSQAASGATGEGEATEPGGGNNSTVAYMHVGPCTSCPGGGISKPGPMSVANASLYPIFCDAEKGPATVEPTDISAAAGSVVRWQPSDTDPTATIEFATSPCQEGTPLSGALPTCTIKGEASGPYPYTITKASGCSKSSGTLKITVSGNAKQ